MWYVIYVVLKNEKHTFNKHLFLSPISIFKIRLLTYLFKLVCTVPHLSSHWLHIFKKNWFLGVFCQYLERQKNASGELHTHFVRYYIEFNFHSNSQNVASNLEFEFFLPEFWWLLILNVRRHATPTSFCSTFLDCR